MDVEALGPNMMKRSESAPNRYVRPIKKLVFATFCSPYVKFQIVKMLDVKKYGSIEFLRPLDFYIISSKKNRLTLIST